MGLNALHSLHSPGGRRGARLCLLLLLLSGAPLAAQTVAAPANAQPTVDSNWLLTRPSPFVTIHVRRAMGYMVLVPAATLLVLYLFRPRPYVLAWIAAWMASSGMAFALSFNSSEVAIGLPVDSVTQVTAGRSAVIVWAAMSLVMGFAHRASALWFRGPFALPRWTGWVAVAAGLWLAASTLSAGPGAAFGPAFVLMTLWEAKGAIVYLQKARAYRFAGALLTGLGLLAIVIGNTVSALMAMMMGGLSVATVNLAYLNLLWMGLMALGMHLLVFEDVIEELRTAARDLSQSHDEMTAMAVTDPLTGCYNRRFLQEIVSHELEQHWRYGLPLALLYVDIDHFKAINDTRGHHVGDQALQTIGAILRARTRQADFVLRWGGDEFLVLLSADEPQAKLKAEEFRQVFLESAIVKTLPDGVDLSVGCVAVPAGTSALAPLIDRADREMYRRKRTFAN